MKSLFMDTVPSMNPAVPSDVSEGADVEVC